MPGAQAADDPYMITLGHPAWRMAFAVLACLVAITMTALWAPAAADASGAASSCRGWQLQTSKSIVREGGWLRIRGVACPNDLRPGQVVGITLRQRRGWRLLGRARVRQNGSFVGRIRIGRTNRRVSRLRAMTARRVSRPVRILVLNEAAQAGGGSRIEASRERPAGGQRQRAELVAVSGSRAGQGDRDAEVPNPNCVLGQPGSEVPYTVNGCRLVASDTAAAADPSDFWGKIDCQSASRHQRPTSGGDPSPTATGEAQGNASYRRLTAFNGDDIWGERCELGYNDHRHGPTALYREGQRRATFFSLRLPDNYPLESNRWQTVFQMKQAQPSKDSSRGAPILEMQARGNRWVILNEWREIWSAPASKGQWTRFMFDVTYSQNPNQGSIQVAVDLDGDGSFGGDGERSPRIATNTLSYELEGGYGIPVGGSVPGHIRSGIYHDPALNCPPPTGCSTEIDNFQVLAP